MWCMCVCVCVCVRACHLFLLSTFTPNSLRWHFACPRETFLSNGGEEKGLKNEYSEMNDDHSHCYFLVFKSILPTNVDCRSISSPNLLHAEKNNIWLSHVFFFSTFGRMLNMFHITVFREHELKFLSGSYDAHDIFRNQRLKIKMGLFLLLPFPRIGWKNVLQAVETKKSSQRKMSTSFESMENV